MFLNNFLFEDFFIPFLDFFVHTGLLRVFTV